jgi:acyl dehydratase
MLDPADLQVGQDYETVLVDDLSRTQLVMYAGASGDYNPLHTDEIYATQVGGYRTVFAHGMLTMGMAGRMLADLVGADALLTFGGRFRAQVWPGDTLTAVATVVAVSEQDGSLELDVNVRNAVGEQVFTGYATARCALP